MLTIRLARAGAKNRAFFHITVADSRKPRDGRFIEKVGYFNPISKGKEIRLEINQERLDYWLSEGAQPSKRVLSLLRENIETSEEKLKREEKKEKKRLKRIIKRKKVKETTEEKPQEATAEAAEPEEVKEEEVKETTEEKPQEATAEAEDKDDQVEEVDQPTKSSEKEKD